MMIDLDRFAQIVCLIVYSFVSLFGARTAWNKRGTFKGINRAKELLAPGAEPTDTLPGSFSRTVGLAGAIGLSGFMWCVGFLLLTGSPLIETKGWATSLQQFVLACSALFAPYAFNRLAQIFPQAVASVSPDDMGTSRSASPRPVPTPTGLIGDE